MRLPEISDPVFFDQVFRLDHAALHRYANFDVQLCIPGWQERADSFEALAKRVWPSDLPGRTP